MRGFTWTCRICGAERPDVRIDVASAQGLFAGALATVNVRHCNDRVDCLTAAPLRAEADLGRFIARDKSQKEAA